MTNYFSWGVYIINFVFFIGISHAGTLVSAILRVTGAEWRRPITRMAEGITVFALVIGGPMIIIDMGRPDRILNVSCTAGSSRPILWDVLSVTTYLSGSLLYLYLPMIPDLAMLRDHAGGPVRAVGAAGWIYRQLALGWQGTPEQWRRLERAISVMAIVIIPVAISVHTVVSWIFGMTLRPGWHSTIFGPYFVVGAIFSGHRRADHRDGAVRLVLPRQHLDRYVTPRALQEAGAAAAGGQPDLHLLHDQRIPDDGLPVGCAGPPAARRALPRPIRAAVLGDGGRRAVRPGAAAGAALDAARSRGS